MKPINMKLLNNLPVEELTSENDYLSIISKGDLIKIFLEGNKQQYDEIKMFALYGEWGSGKSTLMKYLQKELNNSFNTFFFDTWEFETDNNLPLSLLEHLISTSTTTGEEFAEELVEVSEKLFKGFAKSMRVSLPGLSIDGKALVETLESEKKKTFTILKKEFKTEFIRFEDSVTVKNKSDFNIVFIDDLDRCDPENVLNLLSALKLFFTYGKRTIFLCGVDKKAIREAVRTKYGEVVKANEYLEKIFDITFSMPAPKSIRGLINSYFDNENIELPGLINGYASNITEFFKVLRFTNPRRLKKVLNKYALLANFKILTDGQPYNYLIPNIYIKGESNGNYLETILTIYFIILNEFYKEKLDDFYNIDLKKIKFEEALRNHFIGNLQQARSTTGEVNNFLIKGHFEVALNSFGNINLGNKQKKSHATKSFVKIFCPANPHSITQSSFQNLDYFEKTFLVHDREIDYYFTTYLLTYLDFVLFQNEGLSDYKISDFKNMLGTYL